LLAANATVGGPTTAAAMAISKGWNEHVVPAILCGLFVGNALISLIG